MKDTMDDYLLTEEEERLYAIQYDKIAEENLLYFVNDELVSKEQYINDLFIACERNSKYANCLALDTFINESINIKGKSFLVYSINTLKQNTPISEIIEIVENYTNTTADIVNEHEKSDVVYSFEARLKVLQHPILKSLTKKGKIWKEDHIQVEGKSFHEAKEAIRKQYDSTDTSIQVIILKIWKAGKVIE